MTKANPKIASSRTAKPKISDTKTAAPRGADRKVAAPEGSLPGLREIALDRLVPSGSNVRRIRCAASLDELAADIAHRGLLQSLAVRPLLAEGGHETGVFEVLAGGRRLGALQRLAGTGRLAPDAPVPCLVRPTRGITPDGGDADAPSGGEDSLAENAMREALHPLDQFRAFRALTDQGLGEEAIAARFFVTPAVVRQRLRLASVSPRLLDTYAEDGMTLEQLTAFTVTSDHQHQEQVWEALERGYNREPYAIRRMLTEGAVRASDKRAVFVGVATYEAAGGVVLRDLFTSHDDGGWLQDAALLDRLAGERLAREAEAVRAEGWGWVEAALQFPYGHAAGLRRLAPAHPALSEEEQARLDALVAEQEATEETWASSDDDLPEEVDRRLGEVEVAIDALRERAPAFEPDEMARAGAFVSIDGAGALRVERGYLRPQDEIPAGGGSRAEDGDGDVAHAPDPAGGVERVTFSVGSAGAAAGATGAAPAGIAAPDEDEGALRPLPERLVTELTAYRTLALRDALAGEPEVAHLAALHALALRLFYRFAADGSCLEVEAKSASLGTQAPGLADTPSAQAIDARHRTWAEGLPREAEALWDALVGFDADSRSALFAHCVGLTVNAAHEPWQRRPRALAHADRLASALTLDMAQAGWAPTEANYLGRIPKARILEAVREARGEAAAQLIDHLKKADMAREAERLLAGTGWVPEVLRTPGLEGEPVAATAPAVADEAEGLPAFLAGGDGEAINADLAPEPQLIAAE